MTNINFTENVPRETSEKYFLLDRPDRMVTFIQDAINEEYLDNLPLFWKTFRELWTDSEFTHEIKALLFMIISEHWEMEVVADSHNCCENKNEREQYMKLTNQDKVKVYRGQREEDDTGVSWTLDKGRAKWFGQRFYFPKEFSEQVSRPDLYRGNAVLLSGWVKGKDIVSYFNCREEEEVLILTPDRRINDLKIEVLKND